jgi:hypothetical protein
MDVSTKVGYVFPDMPYQSIGQNALVNDQKSYFGLNQYNIKQKLLLNLIRLSIIRRINSQRV